MFKLNYSLPQGPNLRSLYFYYYKIILKTNLKEVISIFIF